jgi:two-component system response regulator YesN
MYQEVSILYTVLIADDEQAVCKGLGALIRWEDYGFKVTDYAFDGKEALDKIKRQKFDLIITDIKMPKLDGLELIKTIRDMKYDTKIIIITAYKDFDHAKRAIKYDVKDFILKPIDEKNLINTILEIKSEIETEIDKMHTVDRSRVIIRNKLLLDMIKGAGNSPNAAKQLFMYGVDVYSGFLYIYLIKVDTVLDKSQYVFIENFIEDIINKYCNGFVFRDSEDKFCILLNFNISNYKNKIILQDELYREIDALFPGKIIICTGNLIEEINNIKSSYEQASKTLFWAWFNREYGLINHDSINRSTPDTKKSQILNSKDLENLIKYGDIDEIRNEIDKIFAEIKSHCYPLENIYSIFTNLFLRLKYIINEAGGNIENILGEDNFFNNMDSYRCKELQETVTNACIKVRDFIDIIRKQGGNRVITEVIEYIERYYCEDLSLKKIAEEFHMNNVYLGKLFYDVTGWRFNDYLNNCRVNNAARLLKTTGLKVYEIAEKVGYRDINYFHRVFKDSKKVSPHKYRKDKRYL